MGIRIENILVDLFEDVMQQQDGPIYEDYFPVFALSIPLPVKFKFSDGEEGTGGLTLSDSDRKKMLSGDKVNKLNVYNFQMETKEDKVFFKISGEEINQNDSGAPAIVKGRAYTIITSDGGDFSKGDDESGETSTEPEVKTEKIKVNKKGIEQINKNLSDLKKVSSKLKSMNLGRFSDDQVFQKTMLNNLLNSKVTNIKINGEPISVTLKKLYDNKLLEAPKRQDIGKKRQLPEGWENTVSKFFELTFNLFTKLNKCCKDSSSYNNIKKFFKLLYIITREGKANFKNDQKRAKLFKRLIGNINNFINSLTSGFDSESGEGGLTFTNESLLREQGEKKQIIFTDFDVSDENIDDSFEDYTGENDIDNDGETSDVDPEQLKRSAFNLYGKDAGRLIPRLSFKYKDIKTIFGLLGRGGLDKRLDKRAEKLGISRYDLAKFRTNKGDKKSMENLPKYILSFDKDVKIEDKKSRLYFKAPKGDKLTFNYDDKTKTLIHKTSGRKYGNVSQVVILIKEEPKLGKSYKGLKIVKMIPYQGGTFETNPNYSVDFTVVDPNKKG